MGKKFRRVSIPSDCRIAEALGHVFTMTKKFRLDVFACVCGFCQFRYRSLEFRSDALLANIAVSLGFVIVH